jgi:DtxR family Mn-dependent transcriptional regulator
MITISKEDYLKAIAEAEAEGQTVIPATLAHWLSVTRPAVTFALKRLRKDGLVSIKKEGHISLTSQGREIAERTMVRHHLIERMLSEMFGMAWYEIHDEAERLEHAVSPAFEKKLVERLGHKETCPHGNGLALRSPAERRKRGMRLLSEAEVGSKYVLASVYERDRKLLEFNTAGSGNDFVGGTNGYGNVEFNGLPALSNGYIVDGLETNDPFRVLHNPKADVFLTSEFLTVMGGLAPHPGGREFESRGFRHAEES